MKEKITLDSLLEALQSPSTHSKLPNNASTWSRIGSNDSFPELNMNRTELESFLTEWAENNPYSNI